MARYYDRTEAGGKQERFQTTCWTEINNAGTLDESRQRDLANELIKKYWKPVYCYLRRKGYSNESAKDMAQGFFHEVVMGRKLIQKADQTSGRFRTFLLTALDRYATDVYRKETALKRLPAEQIQTLEAADQGNLLDFRADLDAEQIYHYAWASEILNQVLADVESYCHKADREVYWNVFYAKVVVPILENCQPPPLKEICDKYGISEEAKASNMIAYVKGHFRTAMMKCLRQFVDSDAEVEDEFNDIFRILSGNSTG